MRKIVLIIIVVILSIAALKVVLFLTAKPKATVDYIAECNKITRPADYNPEDNAAPYYQKAFESFVKKPEELKKLKERYLFQRLTRLDSSQQTILKEWLASNSKAFEYFHIAANKPYDWIERHIEREHLHQAVISSPELISPMYDLVEAVLWRARLNASQQKYSEAFEDIIDCYRAGKQKYRTPSWGHDCHFGFIFIHQALFNAFIILDEEHVDIDSSILKSFQDALQTELNSDTYDITDLRMAKLMRYDEIQRFFVYNGKGTGRLYWKVAIGYYWNVAMPRTSSNCFSKAFSYSFIGPTQNEVTNKTELISVLFDSFEALKKQTPWELHNSDKNYFKKMGAIAESIAESNLEFGPLYPPGEHFHNYYKTRAHTDALITALAIFRFKNDYNRFPETLDELVSTGYLESLPMDPYSDGPLVYKLTEDDFLLYSWGTNFTDDGGIAYTTDMTDIFLQLYTPNLPDTVYWPVKLLGELGEQEYPKTILLPQ